MNLRWTDAGRAALAAAGHAGVAAVKLAHFAIGDGSGPGGEADDARATLRSERHRAAIAGAPAEGRIAVRADLQPDASYGITEAGIFGTAGSPPSAPQLLLYWTDGGAEAGKAAAGTDLALVAVIEFLNAAAEVNVDVGGNIVFGATEPATEEKFGSTRYATKAEAEDPAQGGRAVSPKGLHAAAGKVLATLLGSVPADGSVYQLKGTEDGTLVVELRTQDGATSRALDGANAAVLAVAGRVGALEGKTLAATTARKGIVELATSAEGRAGADTARAMTPKAVRDSTAANIAALLGSVPEQGKRYLLEGLAGGGLKLALAICVVVACQGIENDDLKGERSGPASGRTVDYDAGNYYGQEPFESGWSPSRDAGRSSAYLRYRLGTGTFLFFGAGRTGTYASSYATGGRGAALTALDRVFQTQSVFPLGFDMQKIVAASGANEIQVSWMERDSAEPSGIFLITEWPFG